MDNAILQNELFPLNPIPQRNPHIVYAKTDDANRITAVNSSAFLKNTEGWIEIDSGYGDRFHHASGNYFDKPIRDERFIYRYKLKGGKPVERTQGEMDADFSELPPPPPSDAEKIRQLEEELKAAKILLGLEV